MLGDEPRKPGQLDQAVDLGDIAQVERQHGFEIRPPPIPAPPFGRSAGRLGVAASQPQHDKVICRHDIVAAGGTPAVPSRFFPPFFIL
ncbi:hypothetical protein [Vineibacter terrae]|uniref:hypothetical protein n=1 Tax=Vineibacter terrae TaxID=2586908 RepID=UPI001C498E48